MKYSLSSDDLLRVLASVEHSAGIDDAALRHRLDCAIAWQDELLALSYIFVRVALKRDERWQYGGLADVFYGLEDRMWVTLEEVGPAFVAFLLVHVRDRDLQFEEELRIVHEEYRRHCYENAVRV